MSKYISRMPSPKKSFRKKVLFLVEGTTEENMIFHLFERNDYPNVSFSIKQYQGGGYHVINNWVSKRRDSLDVILVICDLDRANNRLEEKRLIGTIKFLYDENHKNNIFLSGPDFEGWLKRGLPSYSQKPLYHCLGYTNEAAQKSDLDLYQKYTHMGGDLERTTGYFRQRPLFYEKQNFSEGKVKREYLFTEQSSLFYLKNYLQLLNDK